MERREASIGGWKDSKGNVWKGELVHGIHAGKGIRQGRLLV